MHLQVSRALALSIALGVLAVSSTALPATAAAPADRGGDRVIRRSRPMFGTVVEIIASLNDGDDSKATAPYDAVSALPALPAVIEVIGARHPTPDQNSVAAAERALQTVGAASEGDLVLVLQSGGASALWAAPVPGLDLAAKTALTHGLLKSGADTTPEDLRQFCRDHVAHVKVPHGFSFIPELPKTATGKIQKYILRGGRANIVRQ